MTTFVTLCVSDDVDLEDLIRDMHSELSLSRLPLLTHEEHGRLSPTSCCSLSGSSSEEELQYELRHRSATHTAATLSPPLHLRKHKQGKAIVNYIHRWQGQSVVLKLTETDAIHASAKP